MVTRRIQSYVVLEMQALLLAVLQLHPALLQKLHWFSFLFSFACGRAAAHQDSDLFQIPNSILARG